MFSTAVDYLGKWFAARDALGIDDTIVVGKVDRRNGEVRWSYYPHRYVDGVGALANALESEGYPPQEMPRAKYGKPSWRQLVGPTLDIFGRCSPQDTRWKPGVMKQAVDMPQAITDRHPAWAILSAGEKAKVNASAQRAGVSMNTFAFWCLHGVISEHLIDGDGPVTWFYPVNMRGAFSKADRYANHSSGVYVNATPTMSAADFSQVCRQQFADNRHWGLLIQGHVGTLLGDKVVQQLYRRATQKRTYAGSFSTLGQWPRHKKPEINEGDGEQESWLICAPGSPSYPIATGVVEWESGLTCCVKLHPSIADSVNEQQTILKQWVSRMTA